MAQSYDTDSETHDSDAISSSEESENNSEDDYVLGAKRKRVTNVRGRGKGKVKAAPNPTYVAQVTETATDGADASESTSRVDKADGNILARIRKVMKLATHPGTGETEAKVAMRMATKLMQSQNLTQADLIANETAEERSIRAGQSTVTITSTKNKMVRHQRWYDAASEAACEAFDVQVYTESFGESFDLVFYGLADNTVAAALAFEMLHNQIETWAIERKAELKGQSAGNSYRLGVAERVVMNAENENRKAMKRAEEEEKKRIKEEVEMAEAARAAEIARLAQPVMTEPEEEAKPDVSLNPKVEDVPDEDAWKPLADPLDDEDNDGVRPPSYEEGSDTFDDDDVDRRADFDHQDNGANDLDLDALEELVKIKSELLNPPSLSAPSRRRCPTPPVPAVKPEPDFLPAIKSEPSDDADAPPPFCSTLQLRTFRDNAQTIATDYLKDTGLKLRKNRKRKAMKYNNTAYNRGWDDGQKVDLKRRRIEEEEKKKGKGNAKKLGR